MNLLVGAISYIYLLHKGTTDLGVDRIIPDMWSINGRYSENKLNVSHNEVRNRKLGYGTLNSPFCIVQFNILYVE